MKYIDKKFTESANTGSAKNVVDISDKYVITVFVKRATGSTATGNVDIFASHDGITFTASIATLAVGATMVKSDFVALGYRYLAVSLSSYGSSGAVETIVQGKG